MVAKARSELIKELGPLLKFAEDYAGIAAKTAPKEEMTNEKFMEYYTTHTELRDIIDKRRTEEIKGAQDVPQMSPSSGAVNAALNIPQTPKTHDEAYELSQKYFK